MDKSKWHQYLLDPVLSHGLVESEAQSISDGLNAVESAGHIGNFVEAHSLLEKLGDNARALPAYWLVLSSIHGQQGVAKAPQDFRQIEERFPDDSVASPYRLINTFRKANVAAQSDRGTEQDKLESARLGAKLKKDLLTSVDEIANSQILILGLYAYYDLLFTMGEAKNDALHMVKAVFTKCLDEGRIDDVRILPNLLADLHHDTYQGCQVVIDACEKFQSSFPDRSQDTIARLLGDCYARLFQLHGTRAQYNSHLFEKAKEHYTACNSTAGLLDIKSLETIKNLEQLIRHTDDWQPCFDLLDGMFDELQKAQYYRHQPVILKTKEKLMEMLDEPQRVLIDLSYQYKAFAEPSGNSINGTVCIILAQAEVQESDELEKVVGWCEAFKDQEGPLMTRENRIVYLNTLMTAYRRLGKDQEVIDVGNEFIEMYQGLGGLEECMTICGVVMQYYLNRCAAMQPADFADALEESQVWVEMQVKRFIKRRAEAVAADLAVNYCFLLFSLSVRLAFATDTVLVLDHSHVCKMIRTMLKMVDTKAVAPHLLAVVEAALLGMEHNFEDAAQRLQKALPSRISQKIKPLPSHVEAHLKYWAAWWMYQEVAERPNEEKQKKSLTTKEKVKVLSKARTYLESALGAYIALNEAQMCLTCHFDIGKVTIAQHLLQPDLVQSKQGRSDLEKGAEHLLASLDIVDQIRDNLAGESLASYMFKAKMSGGSFITLNHIMQAVLQIHLPEMAWDWVQKFKARSLSDMLKMTNEKDDMVMQRFFDDLSNASAGLPWVDMPLDVLGVVFRFRKLAADLKTVRPSERVLIRQELRQMRQTFRTVPRLAGFIASSGGEPASLEDLIWTSQQAGSQDILFVDYFDNHDGFLGISYVSIERWGDGGIGSSAPGQMGREDGFVTHHLSATGGFHYTGWHKPLIIDDLPSRTIKDWKEEYSTTQALRDESALDGFATLSPIVKPLLKLIKPGKLIVICPNGRLSGIPIHAIPTGAINADGEAEILIERNPIVYVSCMSALRQCVLRSKHRRSDLPAGCAKATVLGAYDKPGRVNDKVYEALHNIAGVLDAQTAIGEGLDNVRFKLKASTTTNIFHFFGHQRNEHRPFHERYLQLDGSTEEHKMSMQEVAQVKFAEKTAPLVTLMACSSAESQPLYGDDPLGLVPVMHMAGAASVIGTLWSAHWPSAMQYSEMFYQKYRESRDAAYVVDLARVHREAVLALKREKPEPYFWASFVLNGSWFQ